MICSMCRARQVWKPLAWAEMPRMEWKETGRPTNLSCLWPRKSVQSCLISMAWLKATSASSAAIRLMRSAEMPHFGRRRFRRRIVGRDISRPCVGTPMGYGWSLRRASCLRGRVSRRSRQSPQALPVFRSMTISLPLSVRINRPNSSDFSVAVNQHRRVGEAREVVEVQLCLL